MGAQLQASQSGLAWRGLRRRRPGTGCLAAEPQCPPGYLPPRSLRPGPSGSTRSTPEGGPQGGTCILGTGGCCQLEPLPQSTFWFSTSFHSNQRVTMATELGCVPRLRRRPRLSVGKAPTGNPAKGGGKAVRAAPRAPPAVCSSQALPLPFRDPRRPPGPEADSSTFLGLQPLSGRPLGAGPVPASLGALHRGTAVPC